MGIITRRRKREKIRRFLGFGALLGAAIVIAAVLALRPVSLRALGAGADAVRRGIQSAQQVFAGGGAAEAELSLPEREIYALQLGVFDSAERAAAQAQRLQAGGVKCMIWQGEKLRIVSDASLSREKLDAGTARGYDTYVYQETMPAVKLRLGAAAHEIDDIKNLLTLPDSILIRLMDEQEMPLSEIIVQVREAAQRAADAHPENALYTQLAQSLVNWCALMEEETEDDMARGYARATMCALCRELRRALSA